MLHVKRLARGFGFFLRKKKELLSFCLCGRKEGILQVGILLDDSLCHPALHVLHSWKEWGLLRQGLQHPIISLC